MDLLKTLDSFKVSDFRTPQRDKQNGEVARGNIKIPFDASQKLKVFVKEALISHLSGQQKGKGE